MTAYTARTLTPTEIEALNDLPVLVVASEGERRRKARRGWIPIGQDAQDNCRDAGCAEPFHMHIQGRHVLYQHGRRVLEVGLTTRGKLYAGSLEQILDWLWACHWVTPQWGYPEW